MSNAVSLHVPFSVVPQYPRRQIRCMTTRTVRPDNLDNLQRTSKLQVQHQPPQQAVDAPIRRRTPPVVLLDRFPTARTVQQMMDTMERLMEEPILSASEAAAASGALNGYQRGGRTPWEIREGEGEYRMRFDMPGMTKKDVKVWLEEGMLVIRAEKQEQQQQTGGAEKVEEVAEWSVKSFGKYNSRIALPENAVVDQIGAEVRDGVLYVTVPKATPTSKVVDIDVK